MLILLKYWLLGGWQALIRWWFSLREDIRYFAISISLALTGSIIALMGHSSVIRNTGYIFFGIGLCFYLLALKKQNTHASKASDSLTTDSHTIHTDGGNYNENIYGNYYEEYHVNVQADYTSMSHDLSQAVTEIKELLVELQGQGCNLREAEAQVVNDLANQAQNNPEIRKRLIEWGIALDIPINQMDEVETAQAVVDFAKDRIQVPLNASISVVWGKYKTLHDLLKAKRWQEADEETNILILTLSRKSKGEMLSAEDIQRLPAKELNTINNLWVKCSGGHFGFSVQKNLFEKVVKSLKAKEKATSSYWSFCDAMCMLGKQVGWYEKSELVDDWIYYSDLNYSLKAPRGHLPVKAMRRNTSYYYSPTRNHCCIDEDIFRVFMERLYN